MTRSQPAPRARGHRPPRAAALCWAVVGSLQLLPAQGFYGGAGYNPPPPICPAFKCPSGEVPVGRTSHQVWSYGCKDAGLNVLNMASWNPKDPLSGMNKQNSAMDKCCVEKDICKQTCGKTSKECHELWQKCSQKTCRGDQNCQLQAMMADMMSEPYDDAEDPAKKYDPDAMKCKAYNRWQQEACTCVPKSDFKSATEDKLKKFYGSFNPEKLTAAGEIKDVNDVWKKWKGKEADMFMALVTKYKAKAVEIREKPKPPPYKPPAKDADGEGKDAFDRSPSSAPESSRAPAEEEDEEASAADPEELVYEKSRADLEGKKKQAMSEEDYDTAQAAKEDLEALTQAEVRRLSDKKKLAIESEDFLEAKRIKSRIERLSEL